jgi:poly(A) polymerase
MKIYLVGGKVRDNLLGVQSNDLDYVIVLDNINLPVVEGFNIMKEYLKKEGFKIFLETESMFTIRAKFPKGHKNEGITGDFVLARKEVGYEEGTRRPILELGTLFDDLLRRDFTINAMAEDEEGNIIDYFNGKENLNDRLLRTPQPALITFNDDPLRLLRALRFKITKRLYLSVEIREVMKNQDILIKLKEVVSQERIREELLKMMKYDTKQTINILSEFKLLDICFGKEMWLKPTFEAK